MFKKTLAIIFTLILLLNCTIIFSVASEEIDPVINMGNSFLRYTSALIIRNSKQFYPELGVVNDDEGSIGLTYNVSSSTTYPVETYCSFDFFGHNYGSLTITLTISSGEAFDGAGYILVGGMPVDNYSYTVSDNSYTFFIKGNIPAHFEVGGIFENVTPEVFNSNNYIVTLYSNAAFVPDYSNMSQDIIDNQNQLQENEKVEAGESGNDSLDSVVDAIPNYQDSLKNAFTNFLEVMADTGTEVRLTFPSISLPAIEGVLPVSIKLSEEMPINLDEWVNKIPADILSLIRNLLTAGLIIYCVKELYSLIEYFFRGGRLSE